MRLNKIVAAVAALSLFASPVAASAARPLSVMGAPVIERAGADLEDSAELGGLRRGMGWILAVVALGILVFVIVELGDDNDLPDSP